VAGRLIPDLVGYRVGPVAKLLEALDPEVVVRSNGAEIIRGAAALSGRALIFSRYAQIILPALINGAIGTINAAHGGPSPS
jgi:hypothetical protein